MEQINLTTPEIKPQVTTDIYKVIVLNFNWEQQLIIIGLRGENGEYKTFTYGGSSSDDAGRTKATNLMIALNKANLSIKSLQNRVITQLINDGFLSGTISGTPD